MKKRLIIYGIAIAGIVSFLWIFHPGGSMVKSNAPSEADGLKKSEQLQASLTPASSNSPVNFIAADGNHDWNERYLQVSELSSELSAAERRQLYDFLRTHDRGELVYATKNDILNVLRKQNTPPPELTDVLLELYRDKEQAEVVRMYALQHMRPWYRMQGQRDPRIREAFYEALDETDSGIAGTALLAIRYLSRDQSGFDVETIGAKALEMAENPAVNVLNRISAIQVATTAAGKTGDGDKYRRLAETEQHTMIRVAAIAAIGQSGDQSQRDYLASIAERNQEPFRTAALNAIHKLDGRK